MIQPCLFEKTAATAIALLVCYAVSAPDRAVAQVDLPAGGQFVAMTPDNRTVITKWEAWTGFHDVDSGKLVTIDRDHPQAFDPFGISKAGKWLIGGGYTGQSAGYGDAREQLKPYSLFYCPVNACLDGTYAQQTQEIDLSPHLPLKRYPNLLPFFEKVIDLGDDRFAVLMRLWRGNGRLKPGQRGAESYHCVVFSIREGSVISARDIGANLRPLSSVVGEEISQVEIVSKTPREFGAPIARTTLRYKRIPLDLSNPIQVGRVEEITGPVLAKADDGESFFAIGRRGAFLGNIRAGETLSFPHWPAKAISTQAVFSNDSSRLAVAEGITNKNRRTSDFKFIAIFDTRTGHVLRKIDFAGKKNALRRTWGLCGFSPDNRYLVCNYTKYDKAGSARESGHAVRDLDAVLLENH